MENIYTILQNLHVLRQKSRADSAHFSALEKLIAARNIPAILDHLTNKTKSGLFKSAYQKELVKLRQHYQLSSEEDAELRQKRLLAAIHSEKRGTVRVQDALDTGSAIIINEVYRGVEGYMYEAGITPLMAAINAKNADAIRLLIRYGANLDKVEDINAVVNESGETILHVASLLKIPELSRLALDRNADPNIRDNDQQTPLYISCIYNDSAVALMLLKNKADPDIAVDVDGKRYNSFFISIQQKNLKLVSAMLKAGHKPNSKNISHAKVVSGEIYKLLKEPFKFRKILTMFGTRHDEVPHENKTLQSLFDVMFIENDALAKEMKGKIEKIYFHKNAILKPLLDLAALAAQGQHEEGVAKGKKFKVIVSEGKNVDDLTAAGKSCMGLYKGKNTIYVAGFHGNADKAMATMMHEMKHFADLQVYGDTSSPYRKSQKSHFMQVKKALLKAVIEFREKREATADKVDKKMFKALASIFDAYKSKDQDAEVLVKVPEIIGYLGVDKGVAWLKKNVPSLLAFYECRFNTACKKYIESRGMQENAEINIGKPKV